MLKKILILICLLFSQNATALCEQNDVKIKFRLKPGKVVYNHSLSKNEFYRYSPYPVPKNTLGLTVSELQIKAQGIPYVKPDGNRYCIGISEVVFEIGYDQIDVLIDKKYRKGSCPYDVIKKHEDYHVRVSQEALTFFQKDIKKELRKAVRRIRPEHAYSSTRADQILKKQFDRIMLKLQPLINHINNKINEHQAEIDTPESYRKETLKCPRKQW